MPTAELIKPRRLRKYGRVWERGTVYPITMADAEVLEDDDRFKVKAFGKAASIIPSKDMVTAAPTVDDVDEDGKPKHHGRLMEAIQEAATNLDEDVEDAFEANGLPSVTHLTMALGYAITTQERDAAMGVKAVERQQQEARAHLAAQERGDMTDLRATSSRRSVSTSVKGEKGLSAASRIKLKKKTTEPLDTGAARAAENAGDEGGEGGGDDPSTAGATEV